jgi:hypothetical protein
MHTCTHQLSCLWLLSSVAGDYMHTIEFAMILCSIPAIYAEIHSSDTEGMS